jgi:hypothetical protein
MNADAIIFRRGAGGNTFALFPCLKATPDGHWVSFQHVGRHAAANYTLCVAHSRPAKPEEYAELKAELEGLGYVLKVCRRRPRR